MLLYSAAIINSLFNTYYSSDPLIPTLFASVAVDWWFNWTTHYAEVLMLVNGHMQQKVYQHSCIYAYGSLLYGFILDLCVITK